MHNLLLLRDMISCPLILDEINHCATLERLNDTQISTLLSRKLVSEEET
jgi:hypothetical protein